MVYLHVPTVYKSMHKGIIMAKILQIFSNVIQNRTTGKKFFKTSIMVVVYWMGVPLMAAATSLDLGGGAWNF